MINNTDYLNLLNIINPKCGIRFAKKLDQFFSFFYKIHSKSF